MQKVLVVVDMQNDFIDGALGTKEAVAIVPGVKEKIENFDGVVLFTRDTHETYYLDTQEGKKLPVPHCIRDTEGWQIRSELDALRKTEPIDKETFGSTTLAGELQMLDEDQGIESITFVGLCTDICVISNALLVKASLPEVPIIVDAKSGTSGAGRGAKVDNLFCEVNENMKAYGVATHRHTPEIEEQLGYACGEKITINFTPHLVPMNRGILATAYASLKKDVTYEEVKAIYDKYYADEQLVRVLEKDVCPQTKWVEGSNYVDVNFKIDPRTNRIIMMGAIDNLVKGAAGQAVQNMNLRFGFPENEGLLQAPMFP